METVGAMVSGAETMVETVNVAEASADVFPAASRALAETEWDPPDSIPRVLDQMVVPAAEEKAPPSKEVSTKVTPTLSEAVPETVTVPETVLPLAGKRMEIVGEEVSAGGGGVLPVNSYAPMSCLDPCGLVMPSLSVGAFIVGSPLSMAGLVLCKR